MNVPHRRRRNAPTALTLALVLALALVLGTVTAATAARPVTKRVVKKIATKVVMKQASRLTVANAERLGGQEPAAYVDRAVGTRATNRFPLQGPGPDQALLGPVTIWVPQGVGGILVEGQTTVLAAAATAQNLELYYAVDAACTGEVSDLVGSQPLHVDAGESGSVGMSGLEAVAPGFHAVQLCAVSSSNTGIVVTRTLTVSTVGEVTLVGDPRS